jgi:hypothetical protein
VRVTDAIDGSKRVQIAECEAGRGTVALLADIAGGLPSVVRPGMRTKYKVHRCPFAGVITVRAFSGMAVGREGKRGTR